MAPKPKSVRVTILAMPERKRGRPRKGGDGLCHDARFLHLDAMEKLFFMCLRDHAEQVGPSFTLTFRTFRMLYGLPNRLNLQSAMVVLTDQGLVEINDSEDAASKCAFQSDSERQQNQALTESNSIEGENDTSKCTLQSDNSSQQNQAVTKTNGIYGGVRGGLIPELVSGTSVTPDGVTPVPDTNSSIRPVHEKKFHSQQEQLLAIPKIDYQAIVAAIQEECPSMPRVRVLNDQRKKALKARIMEAPEKRNRVEYWRRFGRYIETRTTLPKWTVPWGLDWVLNPTNFVKIIEGTYEPQKRN